MYPHLGHGFSIQIYSVKPFFTYRSDVGSGEILIWENSKIISEQSEVAKINFAIKKHNQQITIVLFPTTSDFKI